VCLCAYVLVRACVLWYLYHVLINVKDNYVTTLINMLKKITC